MTKDNTPTPPEMEDFAALFERYKNLVYRTAFLMLGDAAEAEEALQEVFVRVYRSRAEYDPQRGAFTTWLHRITLNYCLGTQRKRRLPSVDLESQGRAPAGEAVEAGHARRSERREVRQALKSLSDKQRAVVVLRYYHDLPYAEIAEALKIPLGTVKSRLDLALRTLRRKLDREDGEPPLASLAKDEVAHEL